MAAFGTKGCEQVIWHQMQKGKVQVNIKSYSIKLFPCFFSVGRSLLFFISVAGGGECGEVGWGGAVGQGGAGDRPSAGPAGKPLLVQSTMVVSFHFPVTGSDMGM